MGARLWRGCEQGKTGVFQPSNRRRDPLDGGGATLERTRYSTKRVILISSIHFSREGRGCGSETGGTVDNGMAPEEFAHSAQESKNSLHPQEECEDHPLRA